MRKYKILYWATTGLVSLGFLASSMMYLSKNPVLMSNFSKLGYPEYFVTLLGFAKLAGSLAIVNPWLPKLKEWAYAGFAFTLFGALWTHIATHTAATPVLVFTALLAASYFFYQRVANPAPAFAVR